MTIDIETSTYKEVLTSILDLITFKEHEGLDATRDWGLLMCLVGIARKQAGISVVVKKDSLGDYWVVVKDPANAIMVGGQSSMASHGRQTASIAASSGVVSHRPVRGSQASHLPIFRDSSSSASMAEQSSSVK